MVIELLGGKEAAKVRGEVVEAYGAAWATTRYALTHQQIRDFALVFEMHLGREDLRLAIAREEPTTPLLGFAYGYTSAPGGWWREILIDTLPAEVADRWFADSFEFVELAVLSEARGRGVGGRLHDALLEGLPNATSVLSTQCGNEAALALYRGRGWKTVSDNFRFPNRPYPYAVMGLELKP